MQEGVDSKPIFVKFGLALLRAEDQQRLKRGREETEDAIPTVEGMDGVRSTFEKRNSSYLSDLM